MNRRASFVLATVTLILQGLTFGPARASTASVTAIAFGWVPQRVSILPGDTVVWSSQDNVTHTVTDTSCARAGGPGPCEFDSGPSGDLTPNGTFAHIFTTPGVYQYQCVIHDFFGTVEVVDPNGARPDLTVDALTIAQASPTAPTTQRLTATVANHTGIGAGSSYVFFEYEYKGTWIRLGARVIDPVPAGGTRTVSQLWTTTTLLGDFQVRAVADGYNQLPETDETNNVDTETASIVLPPGILSPGIDLTDPV